MWISLNRTFAGGIGADRDCMDAAEAVEAARAVMQIKKEA